MDDKITVHVNNKLVATVAVDIHARLDMTVTVDGRRIKVGTGQNMTGPALPDPRY